MKNPHDGQDIRRIHGFRAKKAAAKLRRRGQVLYGASRICDRLFNLVEEAEELEAVIEKLVSTLEKPADEVSAQGGNDAAALLRDALSDPQVKKVIGF